MERTKNVLFVAPHPDDEILGCGGIIAKLKKLGKKVYVAIMTNGNIGAPDLFHLEGTLRGREEAKQSHGFLSVDDTFFYDFPALGLESYPTYKISIAIETLIKELNVDTLFLPHRGDIHKDHRVIFDAALVSARPINNTPVKRIYTYETLSETEWAAPFGDEVFYPTIFVELTEKEIEKKIKAFAFYSPPRRKEYPHSRSQDGIKTLARYRGATIEKPFAEAFMLIREIFN